MPLASTSLIALFLALPFSQQTSSATAVPILRDAVLPRYPPIARAANITGKVAVRVIVNHGLVMKTEVISTSGQRLLESPTVENLKTWHFDANVSSTFIVTYTYLISGTETDEPTNAKVELLPSLDVEITARPVKPTVMY